MGRLPSSWIPLCPLPKLFFFVRSVTIPLFSHVSHILSLSPTSSWFTTFLSVPTLVLYVPLLGHSDEIPFVESASLNHYPAVASSSSDFKLKNDRPHEKLLWCVVMEKNPKNWKHFSKMIKESELYNTLKRHFSVPRFPCNAYKILFFFVGIYVRKCMYPS